MKRITVFVISIFCSITNIVVDYLNHTIFVTFTRQKPDAICNVRIQTFFIGISYFSVCVFAYNVIVHRGVGASCCISVILGEPEKLRMIHTNKIKHPFHLGCGIHIVYLNSCNNTICACVSIIIIMKFCQSSYTFKIELKLFLCKLVKTYVERKCIFLLFGSIRRQVVVVAEHLNVLSHIAFACRCH